MLKNSLTIMLMVLIPLVYGQENSTERVKLGVALQSNFSGIHSRVNGLTPVLSMKFKRNEIAIGPRISFSQIAHIGNFNRPIGADLSYKIFLTENQKRFSLFIGAHAEYISISHDSEWFHEFPLEPSPGPTIGSVLKEEDSFNVDYSYEGHDYGLNLITGIEYVITGNLYVSTAFGLGARGYFFEHIYRNADTDEIVKQISQKSSSLRMNWIASIGLGYRFGK